MTAKSPPRRRTTVKPPTASEIAPGVFVGGWKDATGFPGTRFCVLDEVPAGTIPAEAHIPIYDGAEDAPIRANLDRLARRVDSARARGEPVLLFCGHGVRRGPLAGAWYLHRHDHISLDAAFERLGEIRPQTEHVSQWAGHWEVLAEPKAPRRAGRG
ncbi:MAG: dual specificity protein phosphatase family protein [Thermoplasmata archaeon]